MNFVFRIMDDDGRQIFPERQVSMEITRPANTEEIIRGAVAWAAIDRKNVTEADINALQVYLDGTKSIRTIVDASALVAAKFAAQAILSHFGINAPDALPVVLNTETCEKDLIRYS